MTRPIDRAAFYLCLSRAFLPPREQADYDAIKLDLTSDLEDLAVALGYRAHEALHELGDAVARVPNHLSLLRAYSALFLAPPVAVPLNAGVYLDGALMGPATLALEDCYRQAGLTRQESFHDLADHIALQLEFTAYLCASEAAGGVLPLRADDFLASPVRHWLPAFQTALERGCAADPHAIVYFHLGRVLRAAVDHDLHNYRDGRVPCCQT